MSDQEHGQRAEETSEDQKETMKDLDVPKDQGEDVKGGTPEKVEAHT